MVEGWERFTNDTEYIGVQAFASALVSDCSMSRDVALLWLEKLIRTFKGVRCVWLYTRPAMCQLFDDYDRLPEIDTTEVATLLRDIANRGEREYLADLYVKKREILTHTRQLCADRGVAEEQAPLPGIITGSSTNASKSERPQRITNNTRAIITHYAAMVVGDDFLEEPYKSAGVLSASLSCVGFDIKIDGDWLKRNTLSPPKKPEQKIA